MPQISVDVIGDDPTYGVRADNTFWCKQGILRRNQLREAEDEQFLADLAISILEETPFSFSGATLDEYYSGNSEVARNINARLNGYGVDALKNSVVSTFSAIRETIENSIRPRMRCAEFFTPMQAPILLKRDSMPYSWRFTSFASVKEKYCLTIIA